MILAMLAARGKGARNIAPAGGGGTPPPNPDIIEAQVERLRGSNGAGTAHIMVPVLPGTVPTLEDLDNVVVEVNGTEMAVELQALGQHPDGSYAMIQGWVSIASISAGSPITAEITLNGSPSVARTTVGGHYSYARNGSDPRIAGYPEVVLVPTSVEHLRKTQLTGPYQLPTAASIIALGGQAEIYWKRFSDFSGWWWDTDAGVGTYGTASASTNPHAWEACNTSNTSFGGYGDMTDSTNDFGNWRVACSYVAGVSYPGNAYDQGKTHLEAWLMTGDTTFLLRGLSYIAHYIHEFVVIAGVNAGINGFNGFALFPDGMAAYYLLTGEPMAKQAVQWATDRLRVISGYWAEFDGFGYSAQLGDVNGEARGFDGREAGRFLQLMLAGHRMRLTTSWWADEEFAWDYAQRATDIKDLMLLTGQEYYARKADGTWREQRCTDASGMYINTFMQPLLANELIKYYHQIDPDVAIVTALEDNWDTLYGTLWGIWDYTFNGTDWFTAEVKSFRNNFDGACASLDDPHPNNGDASGLQPMFLSEGAWVAWKTAAPTTEWQDVLDEGVGTDLGSGNGPPLDEPFGYARKIYGEHYHNAWQSFTYIASA